MPQLVNLPEGIAALPPPRQLPVFADALQINRGMIIGKTCSQHKRQLRPRNSIFSPYTAM